MTQMIAFWCLVKWNKTYIILSVSNEVIHNNRSTSITLYKYGGLALIFKARSLSSAVIASRCLQELSASASSVAAWDASSCIAQ